MIRVRGARFRRWDTRSRRSTRQIRTNFLKSRTPTLINAREVQRSKRLPEMLLGASQQRARLGPRGLQKVSTKPGSPVAPTGAVAFRSSLLVSARDTIGRLRKGLKAIDLDLDWQ